MSQPYMFVPKEAVDDCVNNHSKDNKSITSIAEAMINEQYIHNQNRYIWASSKFENISKLLNDDQGRAGEKIIKKMCEEAKIPANIDGTKTKKKGGGTGDGTIKGSTVEIKTSRLNSDKKKFQHELGHSPWKADYMLFLDISPKKIYITLFKNWSEEFYKKSSNDNKIKCTPHFPTKSITWRAGKGDFKLDTSIAINETSCSLQHSFAVNVDDETLLLSDFKKYVDGIIN